MAIGWLNKSSRAEGRKTFGENNSAVTSKAVRRYGAQGSKSDFPEASTGENPAKLETRDIAPSAPAHSHTDRLPSFGIVKTVGFQPDGSARFATPDYSKTTGKHGSDRHEPADYANTHHASGQMHYAEADFGKPTQRPAPLRNTGTSTAHPASLNGDADRREGYNGGRGKV
jgi:hypothetical protein